MAQPRMVRLELGLVGLALLQELVDPEADEEDGNCEAAGVRIGLTCGTRTASGGSTGRVERRGTGGVKHTEEDDAEDDNDTGLLGSPVLTLGQLASDLTGDESGVDGSHCG